MVRSVNLYPECTYNVLLINLYINDISKLDTYTCRLYYNMHVRLNQLTHLQVSKYIKYIDIMAIWLSQMMSRRLIG